ncbi:hypothetical protein KNE206_57570 [Kitasatospora sp. NE20-6]
MVHTSAKAVIALNEEITTINALIEARFREHEHTETITSMPGIGTLLSAEFIACTGGDLDTLGSSRRLSGIARLAPVLKDSEHVSGNMRRPRRYHHRLLRVFHLSTQVAARCRPVSKAFYDRKRGEGRSHKQAVLTFARRRLDVLWALMRDHPTFTTPKRSRSGVTRSPTATHALDEPDWESLITTGRQHYK